MNRYSLASYFIILLPIVALIVPQGTISRTWTPETFFLVYVGLTIFFVVFRNVIHGTQNKTNRQAFNWPMVFYSIYFFFFCPVYAYLNQVPIENIFYIIIQLLAVGYYLILSAARVEIETVRKCIASLAISATILSGMIVFLWQTGQDFAGTGRITGVEGEFTLSLPIVPMGVLLNFYLALITSKNTKKMFWLFSTLLCCFAVFAGVTRSSMLAILASGLLAILVMNPKRLLKIKILFIVIIFAIFLLPLIYPFVDSWIARLTLQDEGDFFTILGRYDEYAAFFEGFLEAPMFGQGIGSRFIYPSRYDLTLSLIGIRVPHNHFFFFLGSTGIVGVFAYYLPYLIAFYRLFQLGRNKQIPSDMQLLATLLLSVGFCGFVFTLFSTTFTAVTYNIAIALLFYSSTLIWQLSKKDDCLSAGIIKETSDRPSISKVKAA